MGKSIIGFHYAMGGNKQGIGDFMRKLNEAGIPFLVKGADDAGVCFEAQETGKAHGVDNWIIYRQSRIGPPENLQDDVPDYLKPPAAAAEEHWEKVVGHWPKELDKSIVWMEPINEPRAKASPDDRQWQDMHPTDWLGRFMLEYARIANANGFKVCGPSFNSGEPEVFSTNEYGLPGMVAYLKYCAENPRQAALSVHEYVWRRWKDGEDWDDWYPNLWGRVEAAMAAADANNIPRDFSIFVTEWGFAHEEAPRWPECEPFLTSYNAWAARWPQVKGVAAWTLQGGWGDVDDHIQSWIAPLTEYARSRNFDAGDQPAQPHSAIGSAGIAGSSDTGEGFDSPVGTTEQRRGARVWPEPWLDANPYLRHYTFGEPERAAFHTGADLNLPGDADRDKPIYACGAGVVIYARLVPESSWGNLVVIRHTMPDGRAVHSRYGHLKQIDVAKGEQVHRGRQIGTIGGADFGLANHLHFDISPSGILQGNPTHWPGGNQQAVRDHYVDPCEFIRKHRPVAPEQPAPAETAPLQPIGTKQVIADEGLFLRVGPDRTFDSKLLMDKGTLVEVLEEGTWDHIRLGDLVGYASSKWLSPLTPAGERLQEKPEPAGAVASESYRYRGSPVEFFTGIHGPASDHVWNDGAFVAMMERLKMPILFMSSGINVNFRHLGDPGRNIVRLNYSFNPERSDSAKAVYRNLREDQLRQWWEKGYRRFIFFNETNLPKGVGQSHEGRGSHWDTAQEFARFLRECLQRARRDFPGIQLYTTPMSPSIEVWAWREAMWSQVSDLVRGYAMHAYSGNNENAGTAAQEIAGAATALQQQLRLQVPLVITEASVNRGRNAAQKAEVAHLLPRHLADVPGVEGVFWYVSDWDDTFDKHNEGWFRKGIADAYFQRAGAIA